jgi:hypothetical protein
MVMTNRLVAGYRATTYRVFLPFGACDLKIDVANTSFRQWMSDERACSYAILTAFNPQSERLSAAVNDEAQCHMENELQAMGYRLQIGENVAAGGDWPVEKTCLVLNVPLAVACEVGAKYRQNALIYGGEDGVPRLVWINKQKNG